jgi:two-component system probable response regulator PhcQ
MHEPAHETAKAAGGTILFVDDEPLSLKYFKASVERYANVLTASSPEAALEIMQAEGDRISVVVSDERMPHESGVSFLSHVCKSWPSTVRILTSAYANIDLQQAINGAGISRFLPKPWNLDELCAAMREALKAEHAEKATETSVPRSGPSETENASLELLAVLARDLAAPLSNVDRAAIDLATLTGLRPPVRSQNVLSPIATWSAQLRLGKIAASASEISRHIELSKSLANAIVELAEGLCRPEAAKDVSMAETASEVLEQIGLRQPRQKLMTLDARQDFTYRAPKPIMKFVLLNVLQGLIDEVKGQASPIAVELVPGFELNEVRIIAELPSQSDISDETSAIRASRCSLWAFGGELLRSYDENLGMISVHLRLPSADTGDVSPSH